jgi:hypothetical protein
MILDIIGLGVLLFLSGLAIFAVGIHLFIILAQLFGTSVPNVANKANRNLRVIERDYDYDTDY